MELAAFIQTEPPTPNETHLPPHERKSVTRVPVTPGVALGTYDSDYFGAAAQETSGPQPRGGADRLPTLTGNVISATFATPHTVQYHQGSEWQLSQRSHRSALLDSLHYLSDTGPWDHTIVAWTGEIQQPSETEEEPSEPDTEMAALSHAAPNPKFNDLCISNEDQRRLEQQLAAESLKTVPVWLADKGDISETGIKLRNQRRWRRYAEHDLCAVLHYRQHPPTGGFTAGQRWADYCRMNQMFADRICEVYHPGDVILVHDYHLMLLPALLRQRHPDIRISFFLHTPFPSSEMVRCLVRRNEILSGLLGSDVVAFQSFHYAQHFANSCSRILDLEANHKGVYTSSRRVRIAILPAGINVSNIHSLAWSVPVTEKCLGLRKLHADKKIIVACDPLDRLGGVDKKLQAFDRFLEMYPEWRERVVLLQLVGQATIEDDVGEESHYASNVSALVNSINCKYGSLGYMPVQLQPQRLSTDDYFALLRSGDIALFSSIHDGMSTTSLEYVVCQQNTYGCTIISEFSGTVSSLEEAMHINPWDTVGVAERIHEALSMTSDKRQAMHMALYKRITQNNVKYWVNTNLHCLMDASQSRQVTKSTGPAGGAISSITHDLKRRLMVTT
uniref:Trehalose-6-phosphatase TPPA homeolog p n=1 Tax=Epichloe coenophiala TaxID=5047 RepID=A0A346R8Z9_EPICN|nr:trehalose-6-phosphatase TPPA homeolog p [Epichloe coenophiala]